LNDALVALAEGVLEIQQPDHQPDRQARAPCRARARARHLQGRAEQIQAFDRTPLAVLAGKARRQRRFDLGPRHAGRQYGQRVTQIDHRVQPGAEKIRGGHRKPALQIFQKVNAIALETGGFGKASGASARAGKGRADCSGPTNYSAKTPGISLFQAALECSAPTSSASTSNSRRANTAAASSTSSRVFLAQAVPAKPDGLAEAIGTGQQLH
jgi:hypothetical protein